MAFEHLLLGWVLFWFHTAASLNPKFSAPTTSVRSGRPYRGFDIKTDRKSALAGAIEEFMPLQAASLYCKW